jgi:hypothetical protein
MSSGVSADRRFRKSQPCPICGGYDEVARGTGQRCYGFRSDDGQWAHCIAVHLSVFEPGGQVLGNPSPLLFLCFVTEPTSSGCPERP